MAEKPILFNTQMVRAILENRKKRTRRIIKGLPLYEPFFEEDEGRGFLMDSESGEYSPLEAFSNVQVGDVLWVRETWQRLSDFGEQLYVYKADYKDDEPLLLDGLYTYTTWRPSIHMPREAARIFLRVTGIRAERLQDITPLDVRAEGIKIDEADEFDVEASIEAMERFAFEELWDSTVKPADLHRYGWDANPWVWVYEFERIEGA